MMSDFLTPRTGSSQGRVGLYAAAGIAAVWAFVALVAGPWLIAAGYAGTSFGFINAVFAGRSVHPLGDYLAVWRSFALKATIGLAVAGVAALAVVRWRSAIRTWIERILFGHRTITASRAAVISIGLGLVSGFAEFVVMKVSLLVDGRFLHWSNPDTIWAAPIVLASFTLVASLPFVVAARSARRGVSARTVVIVIGAMCWYAVLRSTRLGIHPLAAIVLAVGLSTVSSPLLLNNGLAFRRHVGKAVGGAALAFVVLAAGMSVSRIAGERLAAAGLPQAPDGAMNVIFVFLDTVRAQSMSLYGYERPTTPNLERIGKRGVVFDRAITPSPWTLPAHASAFSGLLPWEHGADWRTRLDGQAPTLAEFLRDHGYLTAGFVANLGYTTKASGLARGFIHYEDYGYNALSILGGEWYGRMLRDWLGRVTGNLAFTRREAPEVSQAALDWIDRADRPFFVFLNYFDAHGPYEQREAYSDDILAVVVSDSMLNGSGQWVKRSDRLSRARDRYDTSIAWLDAQTGALFDALEERGLLENTLVVITSDHGEQFGEHGMVDHGNSLYDPLLHVPLIITGPGIDGPRRVPGSTPLRDLPATVAIALDLQAESPFRGRSLISLHSRGDVAPDARFVVSQVTPEIGVDQYGPLKAGPAVSISQDMRRLIRYGDGSEVLYDLRLDPLETRNVADSSLFTRIAESLAARLDSILAATRLEPRPTRSFD